MDVKSYSHGFVFLDAKELDKRKKSCTGFVLLSAPRADDVNVKKRKQKKINEGWFKEIFVYLPLESP